jgi:hypothetical protein
MSFKRSPIEAVASFIAVAVPLAGISCSLVVEEALLAAPVVSALEFPPAVVED